MKHVLLIKNLNDEAQVRAIHNMLADTRASYEVDFARKCVIVYGNQDMVFIVRKALNDLGLSIL